MVFQSFKAELIKGMILIMILIILHAFFVILQKKINHLNKTYLYRSMDSISNKITWDKTIRKHSKTVWRDGLWGRMEEADVESWVDLEREYSEHRLGLRSALDVNIGEDVSG